MNTSFGRARNLVVVGALLAASIGGVGVPAAQAAEVNFQGVNAVTTATGPGQGSLALTAPTPLPVFITGGTFADGENQATVQVDGVVPYNCTGSAAAVLTVSIPMKGGALNFDIAGPCGAVVVQPPAPSWNQSATIVPGTAGSGNADVLFDNEESNRTGGFYVTIGNGAPTSATSVAAGQTKSISVHGEPGAVIRVYGTKDGTAAPQLLKELTLPKAPAAPAPPDLTPAANQPVGSTNGSPHTRVNTDTSNRKEWKRPVFDTAASAESQAVSPWAVLGFAVAGFAAIYLVGSVVVHRRRG
ncbi:MAG: hypothetical protein ABWX90_03555 [Candidatus Saccharimonadales bacterium]